MKKLKFEKIILCFIILLLFMSCNYRNDTNKKYGFVLYQLPPEGKSQLMMSYIIRTIKNNKVIVIDGGTQGDAEYLQNSIKNLGGHVNLWIITHPHDDHADALYSILSNACNIKIDKIIHCFPKGLWVQKYEPQSMKDYNRICGVLNKSDVIKERVKINENINIDGVNFKILSADNPEITINAVNNSSMVFKVYSKDKSVLFLSDAGKEEGEKVLKTISPAILKSDYVQMAHHGQNGVSKNFYDAVLPKYCLWPTPIWVWNNDPGTGYNTGNFDTINVRKWMREIGVKNNYISSDSIVKIEI